MWKYVELSGITTNSYWAYSNINKFSEFDEEET